MSLKSIYPFCVLFAFSWACHAQIKPKKLICSCFAKTSSRSKNSPDKWASAKPVRFSSPEKSDNEMTVSSCWDHDSLYFRFDIIDSDLRAYQTEKDHPKLYLDDMIEILLDPRNDQDTCWAADDIVYHINLLGQKKDDRGTDSCMTDPNWDGKASYRIVLYGTLNDPSDIDTGYRVELALPWDELGVKSENEKTLGVNFANGDNDGNGRQLYDWVEANPMRSPNQFGTLQLTEE